MPDIKTKTEYAQYEANVSAFIQREGISYLSTGTADRLDPDIHSEKYQGREDGEPWFSFHPCECCQSPLGGNREYLFARDKNNNIVQFTICEDCVYYVNYGRLDDTTMEGVD